MDDYKFLFDMVEDYDDLVELFRKKDSLYKRQLGTLMGISTSEKVNSKIKEYIDSDTDFYIDIDMPKSLLKGFLIYKYYSIKSICNFSIDISKSIYNNIERLDLDRQIVLCKILDSYFKNVKKEDNITLEMYSSKDNFNIVISSSINYFDEDICNLIKNYKWICSKFIDKDNHFYFSICIKNK